MSVVPRRIEFAMRTRSQRMYRMYILWRACGCFLYAPSIYAVYFKRRWFKNIRCICFVALPTVYILVHCWQRVSAGAETSLLLKPAASLPLLKILNVSNGQGCPWFHAVARFELRSNLVVEQCTRKYTAQQSISKGAGGAFLLNRY